MTRCFTNCDESASMKIDSQQHRFIVECLAARVSGLVGQSKGLEGTAAVHLQRERDLIAAILAELDKQSGTLVWD